MSTKNKLHTSVRLKAFKDVREFTGDMLAMTQNLQRQSPTRSQDLFFRREGRMDAYSLIIEHLDGEIAKLEERYARE